MKGTSQPLTILYYLSLPIVHLLRFFLFVLHWIATPFIYIAHYALQLLLIPVRIAVQFEALVYFILAAVFLGSITGLILHFTLRIFVKTFDLDRPSTPPKPKPLPATGHDAASYRAAREAKRAQQIEKEQRNALRARLLASQPLIQEVVREARRNPISGPVTSPKSPKTSTAATKSGLFERILFEHSEEDEASESAF